jgi:membrane protein CcdC involved in cytochrome C biogenesis
MVSKIMKWVSIMALLVVASWRPSANYQILLHFWVCAGAVMVVLPLFFVKPRVETHCAVDNRADVGKQITVML